MLSPINPDEAKALVQAQFGANAANYASSPVHAKGASLQRLVDLVGPQAHWTMLDIATGAGHTALVFAPHVAHVVASDLTPEMLAQTVKLAAEGAFDNVATAVADAEKLPFANDRFDLVTCRIAPHHFTNVAAFVAEARRVLKPGGTFALVDNVAPDATTQPGFEPAEIVAAAAAYNDFEKLRDPSHGRALGTAEWQTIVADAGLVVRHVEHCPKAMMFATWCKTMSVDASVMPRLEAMLDGASPALGAFLTPAGAGAGRSFVLSELILVATKA